MHEYLILIHDWSHLGIVAALVLAAYVMCSTTCMILYDSMFRTVSRYNSREYVMRPTFVSIAHFQDSGRHDFCALEDELEA